MRPTKWPLGWFQRTLPERRRPHYTKQNDSGEGEKKTGRKIGREIYVVNILIMLQNKTDWLSYNESHFRNNNVLTCMGCVESENENYGRFFLFQIPHLLFSRCSNFYHLPRFLRNLCAFSPKVHRSNFPFSLGSAGCWRTLTGAAHL